jgi:hypothetical protein
LCFLENNAPNPSVTNPRIVEGSGTDWIDLVATCKLSIEKSPLPPTGDISIRDAGIDVTIPKNLNEFGLRLLPETVACSIRLLEASKAAKGSAESNRKKVGSVTWDQVKAIATDKMQDMNCWKVESAMKMVAGSARSMGITVTGDAPFEVK